MNPKDTERVLDEISREQLPSNLNLLPGIVAKIEQGSQPKMNTPAKLLYAALLLAVLLIVAFFSLPGVASAVRGLFGYIPGVGRVDQSAPLRVLATPVTDEREGYTITVESAVLDSARTVLNYRISGQFPAWDDPMLMPTMCQDLPSLRLPDGTMLGYPSRVGSSGGGDSTWQDIHPAVPAGVNRAVLVLPCLSELPAGEGPANWEIPLAFAPAPPQMTVFPVIQPVTPEPAAPHSALPPALLPVETAPTGTTGTPLAADAAPSPAGWQWTLGGVATLEDGYYLETLLQWEEEASFNEFYEVEIYPDAVHLFDANDQEVSVWMADQMPPMALAEAGSLALNLQTMTIAAPGPARLVLDYIAVSTFPFAAFTLDVGSDPQPGQTWQVNKELEIDGRTLRVVSAEYVQAGANEPAMLMLYLESDSGILSAIATDKDHGTSFAGGSPASAEVPFRSGLHYANGFPEGTLNIEFSSIVVRRDGPWTLAWTPPLPAPTTGTPALPTEPGICQNATPQPIAVADLPGGLGGRVAFTEISATYDLFVSDLDGSNRIAIGPGLIPQLSPDGRRIAYRGIEGGLYVRDLSGTESVLVTGPFQENVNDTWPEWSPDGRRLAFNRTTDHQSAIYVVNAGGTDLNMLISEPGAPSVLGWSPDGQQIIYQVITQNGERIGIRTFDIPSGQSREVATLPLESGQVSLSPDATRMIHLSDRGVFLQALDGSAPVLLHADANLFISPVWSPDGQWILMSYLDGTNNAHPAHVLLQVDTCRLLRFEAPLGTIVSSWAGK